MKIKIDKADSVFSDYIRLRDRKCCRCGRPGKPRKSDGLPIVGLQCSHFHGRKKESTRFCELNCQALCHGCHVYFTSQPLQHANFMRQKLGEKTFDLLTLKANSKTKRDRQMQFLFWQNKLNIIKSNIK